MAENNSILVCRYLCEELPPRDMEDVELRMKLDDELQRVITPGAFLRTTASIIRVWDGHHPIR